MERKEEALAVTDEGETVTGRLINRNRSGRRLILLPGIGYGFDRFLLGAAGELALERGYEVLCLSYGDIRKETSKEENAGGKPAFLSALDKAVRRCLKQAGLLDWNAAGEIRFLSKSFGTLAAGELRDRLSLPAAPSLFLTPLAGTFSYMREGELAVSGSRDRFISREELLRLSQEKKVRIRLYEGADHSLEVKGKEEQNRAIRKEIEELYREFLE